MKWDEMFLNHMPDYANMLISINDEIFKIVRRDFKRNKVWVKPA